MPPGAPLLAHMVLFEHQNVRGQHRHVFQEVASFHALDQLPPPPPDDPNAPDRSFDNKTSSMMVFLGNWQTFADETLGNEFRPILGPGLYTALPQGIDNDAISSVTPSDRSPTVSGSLALGHVILFEHGQLHGDHKHILNAEPDLNNDEDDSFNDETSSLVVYSNTAWEAKWKLYRDSNYHARFDVILGVGRFPSLGPTNIANDELSSLELAGDTYAFSGEVTVQIMSGNFPDPITHDVTLTLVILPDTMTLLLETPFEPFGPERYDDQARQCGYRQPAARGTLTLPATDQVTKSIGVADVDVVTTCSTDHGHVDSRRARATLIRSCAGGSGVASSSRARTARSARRRRRTCAARWRPLPWWRRRPRPDTCRSSCSSRGTLRPRCR